MTEKTFTFISETKKALWVYSWEPEASVVPKGVVQIAHGMAEHARRYRNFASSLTSRGFIVYANDHRGHGKSENSPQDLGYFGPRKGWELAVRDVYSLSKEIGSRHPGLPLFLFGHSMGSLLVRTYLADYPIELQGAVLSGTAGMPSLFDRVTAPPILRAAAALWGEKTPSPFLNRLFFGGYTRRIRPARTKFDWLTTDEAEVDAYNADPLCGFICKTGFFLDLFSGVVQANSYKVIKQVPKKLPLLFISGAQDPAGSYGRGVARVAAKYKKAGCKDVSFSLYPNARHELLNEKNREEVYRDLITWFESRLEFGKNPGSETASRD